MFEFFRIKLFINLCKQGEKNNSIEKNNNKLNDSMQLDSYLIRQPVIHKFER